MFIQSLTTANSFQPIAFEKINKIYYLAEDANKFENDGLSIKAKKADEEIKNILNSIFINKKEINSTKECIFIRDTFNRETFGSANRYFKFSCYNPPTKARFQFQIFSESDTNDKSIITSNKIIEKFEEASQFVGKIIILNYSSYGRIKSYSFDRKLGFGPELTIYCKIVSLSSIDSTDDSKKNNSNQVMTPSQLLRKLETGEKVKKQDIIKTLKNIINENN